MPIDNDGLVVAPHQTANGGLRHPVALRADLMSYPPTRCRFEFPTPCNHSRRFLSSRWAVGHREGIVSAVPMQGQKYTLVK
jgi:hypothetical protein